MSNIFTDFEAHLEIYKTKINQLTQELAQAQQINGQLQAENKKLKESED